jgi:hypothetical protein
MKPWTGAILALLIAAPVWAESAPTACREDRVALRGDWGKAEFRVEVADDARERAQGLMFRERMAPDAGMLFVYDMPQPVSFWMRNTLIPLDMIFADGAGVVQTVHANARPLDETPIFGGAEIAYVLEINGGMAERIGIVPGSELRHPALGATAAWPCR